MITFSAPLWIWSAGKGSWHFITVPEPEAAELRLAALAEGPLGGFGSVRVSAAIDDVCWRTSVFPQKGTGYLLPIKADVRRRAGIAAGDVVRVRLEIA